MTTETPDYMQVYADRWAKIVQNPDGTLNLDQVARELADYDALMSRATEVYLAVTDERIGNPSASAQAVIGIANERTDQAVAAACPWWIATERLSAGGERVLGPFPSRELALEVRGYVERANAPVTYWVVSEDDTEGN